jgi:hypothetical protein
MPGIALVQRAHADLSGALRNPENGRASFSAVAVSAPLIMAKVTEVSANVTIANVTQNATAIVHSTNLPHMGEFIALIGLATVAFVVVRRH